MIFSKLNFKEYKVKKHEKKAVVDRGGSNATGAPHRALIHAVQCGGMSEEAAHVSGVWPPSRNNDTVVDVLR